MDNFEICSGPQINEAITMVRMLSLKLNTPLGIHDTLNNKRIGLCLRPLG
jgi:hypothetical protein